MCQQQDEENTLGNQERLIWEGKGITAPPSSQFSCNCKEVEGGSWTFSNKCTPKLAWCESLSGPALKRRFIFRLSSVLLASRDAAAKGSLKSRQSLVQTATAAALSTLYWFVSRPRRVCYWKFTCLACSEGLMFGLNQFLSLWFLAGKMGT